MTRKPYFPEQRKNPYVFREIANMTTGVIYTSFIEAANALGCSVVDIDEALNNPPYTYNDHLLQYADGEGPNKKKGQKKVMELPITVVKTEEGKVLTRILVNGSLWNLTLSMDEAADLLNGLNAIPEVIVAANKRRNKN